SCRCFTPCHSLSLFLCFPLPPTPEFSTLSLHDALPISSLKRSSSAAVLPRGAVPLMGWEISVSPRFAKKRSGEADIIYSSPALRSEEHTSELQSRENLVCRLLLEKKNNHYIMYLYPTPS